jgi:two-component sensor histidine kinase
MSDNIAKVNFQSYLEKLTRHLCSSFTLDNNIIKVNINVSKMTLDIEKVIPLGLILNELINNSIKHAFPEGEGVISITLIYKNNNFLRLHYYDNGIGLPENYGNKETLGIKLIWDLVRQLEGHLEIEKVAHGSSFIIHFPK